MLVIPIGIAIGYFAYARFLKRVLPIVEMGESNLFLFVRDQFNSRSTVSLKRFDLLVTIPLLLIFLFVFAFELFASSSLIAAFMGPENLNITQIIVGGALFMASLANSFFGGMQANVKNDKVLAVGILLLLALISISAAFATNGNLNTEIVSSYLTGSAGILAASIAAVLALINAVSTQFYSLLNAYSASNFSSPSTLKRSMDKVGIVVALVLGLIVIIGATTNLGSSGQSLPMELSTTMWQFIGDGYLSVIVVAVIIFGMSAIVLSTTDTLMLALTYFVYRHVLNKPTIEENSKQNSHRTILVALFALGFIPLVLLFLVQPNLFYLLLTVATGASVYAPFIIASAIISAADKHKEIIGAQYTILGVSFLFICAAVWAAYSALVAPSALTPFISLIVFGLSIIICTLFSYRNRLGRGD